MRPGPVTVPPNSMLEVASDALPEDAARDPRRWLYAAVLRDAEGPAVDQSIWTLRPHRELALATPDIRVVPVPTATRNLKSGLLPRRARGRPWSGPGF